MICPKEFRLEQEGRGGLSMSLRVRIEETTIGSAVVEHVENIATICRRCSAQETMGFPHLYPFGIPRISIKTDRI